MSAEIIDINERARDLWEAYLAAKERADITGEFSDARRAGRLWCRFLDLCAGDTSQRGTVLQFKRKAP